MSDRDIHRQKALENFVRAAEAVMGSKTDSIAAAMLFGSMALLHVAHLGGDSAYTQVKQILANLSKEADPWPKKKDQSSSIE